MSDRQVPRHDTRCWARSCCWLLIGAVTPLLCSCQSAPSVPLLSHLAHRRPTFSQVATVDAPPMTPAPAGWLASVSDMPAVGGPAPIVPGNGPSIPTASPASWEPGNVVPSHPIAPAAYVSVIDSSPAACEYPALSENGFNGSPQTLCGPPGLRCPWPPDEYICDGGDGEILASVGGDLAIRGLEPEDTVLHYDTLDGRTVVKASNRVCIYAPRFAAVRKVTGVLEKERHQRVSRVDGEAIPIGMDDLQIATHVEQPLGPERQIGTKLANILDEQSRGVEMGNSLRLVQERRGLLPYEDFTTIRRGLLADIDETELAESSQAASVWTLVQAVQLVIDGQQAEIQACYKTPSTIYQYQLSGKPRMQVVKMASTSTAQPGDFVDFTIYFDNIGTQKVNHVTIVDNLTPRLQYVPDSQQCSRDVNFSAEVNEGESLLLRWDMNEPLPPHEGGVIHFRCKVR